MRKPSTPAARRDTKAAIAAWMPAGQPILALEKRIAFDAAAVATAAKVTHAIDTTPAQAASHIDTSRYGDLMKTATSSDASSASVTTLVASSDSLFGFRPETSVAVLKSVVFIESDVPDVAALIKDVSPSATIVMLDASKDGVDAIASYLSAHKGVQDVYIFSHGSEANLFLGTADLDSASMTGRYAADLATIKSSLGANANLLVYGCDFAQNTDGDSAAHLLSQLTGANVAASTNLTGGTAEGGDFVLEDRIGTITAPDVLKSTIATDYDGLLASPTTVFATSGTGAYHSNLEFLTYANTTLATGGITNGATATYKTADGSTVTATFSVVSNATDAATYKPAAFSAYAPSKFYGGYNNTSSTSETLYGGGYSGTVSFTVSFTAVDKNGKSYTPNIAFVDSELTDSSGEYYTVTTNGGSFQNVETIGSTGYSLTGVGTQSVTLSNDSAGVPLLVTTGASSLNITVQTSGGKEGFALALVEPTLTLDANNSSGSTGANYATTFTEKGAAVSIADTDTTAVEPGVTTASSATIVLTNAQANDLLNVGSLPSGITDTIDTSVAGQITVKLSGTASLASYQSAIQAVTFSNTSSNPSTVDRVVDVTYNDGSVDSNTAVSTIHVAAVNDAPVETTPAAQSANINTTLSISGLSVSDVDANGGSETVTLSVAEGTISLASTSGLTFSTGTGANDTKETFTGTLNAINNAIATVKYQPTTNYSGADTLSFVTNDNGNTGSGGAMTTTKTVGITVDTPPTAVADTFSTPHDTSAIINVLGNDTDALGRQLTITEVNGVAIVSGGAAVAVTGGAVTLNSDGTLTFAPTAGYTGSPDFTYTIADPVGETSTATVEGLITDAKSIVDLNGPQTVVNTIVNGNSLGSSGWSETNGAQENGGYYFNADYSTGSLSQANVTGLNHGSGAFGAAQLSFGFAWNNGNPDVSAATVNVTVGGVIYAQIVTGAPGSDPDIATITYLNGAAGNLSSVTQTAYMNWTPIQLKIDLPANVAASGTVAFNVDASNSTDDVYFSNVSTSTLPITTYNYTTSYAEKGAAVTIAASNASVFDGDNTNLTSSSVVLTNKLAGDQLSIGGTAVTNGSSGTISGLTYSVFDSNGAETIALSGSATTTAYQRAIAQIAYSNNNYVPSTTQRIIDVTTNDGISPSNTAVSMISVNDLNPSSTGKLANQAFADGQSGVAIATAGGFADPSGSPFTYSASGLPTGLSIDSMTGKISGTIDHDASKNAPTTTGSGATLDGTYTVIVRATDTVGRLATQSFTIDSSNQAPAAGMLTPNQSSKDGQAITPVNTASTFTDPNGDPLTYTVSNLPAGLSIDAATGQITGTVATTATPGTYIVHVVATDDKGAAARENFNWTIQDVPPTANGTLANQTYADSTANIAIATAGGFTNPNNLAFTYTASGLPAGLSIDAATGKITGQLSHDASKNAPKTGGSGTTLDGTYTVSVMVSDGQGGTATQMFTIDATNTAPTVVAATPNQSSSDGATTSIATGSAFNDANTGDMLTYSATGLPKGVTINTATGLISGTIDKSASVGSPYAVAVTATDDKGAATTENFQWAIINVAPTATPALPDRTAYDGSTVAYATSGGFTNPNSLTLTYTATGLPKGTTIDPSTGIISGTLDHDASILTANGTYTIAVTVNDGQGGTATNTFHLVASNQAPALGTNTPNQTTTDGQTIATLDASVAFSDPNGDPLTYSASGLPAGLSIDQTGKITGTVAATAKPGIYSVVVTATDDKGLVTPETFTWTVNDATPVASGSIANAAYADSSAGVSIATAGAFTSPNNLPLTYTATGLPSGLSIDATTGKITGQLDHDASKNAPTTRGSGATLDGTYAVVVSASDGQGGIASTSFTIDANNNAPAILAQTPTQNSYDGNTAAIDTSAVFRDANTGDVLTYTAMGLPKGLTIDATTGIISGTIDKSASTIGPYTITVTATDDKGAATTETFAWTVADVTPVATPSLPGQAAPDGSTVNYQTVGGFTNPNGLTYTFTATGLPSGLTINAATGLISGTLDHDASTMIANGRYTIAVSVDDGQGGTATSSFNLVASNQAPKLGTKTADQMNTDGDSVTAVDASKAFSDPNTGDMVTYTANTLPAGLSIDASTGVISGTVSRNAAPGTYAVVVTATDNEGAATTEVFNWVIADIAPGLSTTPIASRTVHDSDMVSIDTTVGFTSLNGLPLTYSATGLPVGLYLDPKTGQISGTIDHDASANGISKTGVYQVTVTTSDGQGGSNEQTFSVTSVNDAPAITAQTPNQESTAGNPGSLDVGVAFSDKNLGDVVSYAATGLPTGLVIDSKTGLISGTIDPGAASGSPYSVSVTATDDKGLATTETFAWTIDPVPANAPPIANVSTFDGNSVTIETAGNFDGSALVYIASGLPKGLTINATTGVISGVIDHDASKAASSQTGSGANLDGFYSVSVTAVGVGTKTFVIDSANQAPSLVAMKNTADQTTPAGQTIGAVDASLAFSDPNTGDTLTYTASELPAGLSINASTGQITGTVSKTASPGAYPVLVTATDDKSAATVERFTWTVTDVAPTPNGTIANQIVADSTTGLSIGAGSAFANPNGLPLVYSATGLPKGLSIDPTTGAITGQLDHDASNEAPNKTGMGATLDGTYTIVVSANDGQGGVATQTFTIDATNTAPVIVTVTANQTSADGNTASIDASTAFHDPNVGDVLTYTASNLPTGLTIDANTGMITGTIAKTASAASPYSVAVTATDDKGAMTTETFTWTVSDVGPVATPPLADQAAHDADTVSYTTANGFTNPNNSTLTYSANGLPNGLMINTATGVISGTLDKTASIEATNGTYTIAVTVNDGQGGTATNTFLLVSTNLAPVVGTKTASETLSDGQTITPVDASTAFSDPNGDALTFSASNLPAGLMIDSATGKISGTVAGNAAPGVYVVTVTATDTKGAPTLETFSWTVNDLAPTKNGIVADQTLADGTSGVSFPTAQTFKNPNTLPFVYSATGLPSGLSIDPATGVISGQLDHDASKNAPVLGNQSGTYQVVVSVADGLGGVATQVFNIDATNQAPVLGTATANQHSVDGNVASVDTSTAFADPNAGDVVTYGATGLPNGLTIDPATGLISGTIGKSASVTGPYTVVVTATDDKGAATTETFIWTVDNVAPVATPPLANRSVPDGTTVAYPTVTGFTNPNALPFTYTVTGLPSGLMIDNMTGVISGTVNHDASAMTSGGIYSVAVTVDDGQGGTATNAFMLVATNQAAIVGTKTVNQDVQAGQASPSIDTSKAFTDPNGDPLTYSASNLPNGLTIDPSTGLITGTVATNAKTGVNLVTVTATDDKGAVSNETFLYTVGDVPPVAVGTIAAKSFPDSTTGVSIDASVAFSNPSGLPLTFSVSGLPRGLIIDPSTGVIGGFIGHDASKNAPMTSGAGATLDGTYTVTVTADDGQGGTAIQTFTIDATNNAPTLGTPTPSQQSADGDMISLNASLPFADPNIGDVLTYAATGLPKGLSLDPATGIISGLIDPHASVDVNGSYTVAVTVTDDKGAATTETFNWTVVDAAPIAAGIAPVSAPDGVAITPIDAASGFGNPNNLPLTFSATGLPKGLSIDPTTGQISGTLDHDASLNAPKTSGYGATLDGTYTVVVTADDGQGGVTSQSFTIDAVNKAPAVTMPTADQHSTDGSIIALDASKVFADPDVGDALTYVATGLPKGLWIDPKTGLVSGTIDSTASASSPYTTSIVATDDKGAAVAETFVWTIDDVAPIATGPIASVSAPDGVAIQPIDTAGAFASPNGLPLIFSATGLPAGLTIDPATGRIDGTPDHDASLHAPMTSGAGVTLDGTYTVVVTASDGQGGAASQTFKIDAKNQAPIVAATTPDQASADGQSIGPLDAAHAFNDPNGDPLVFSATGLPPGLGIDPVTGAVTGTVAKNAKAGGYQVVITATDDKGASGSETFVWTVKDVAPVVVANTPDQASTEGNAVVPVRAGDAFVDPYGIPLSFSATGLPPGLSIDSKTGMISGTIAPGAGRIDTYAVMVTATDENGVATSETFAWHVDTVSPSILASSVVPRSVMAANLTALTTSNAAPDPALKDDLRVSGVILDVVHQISGDPEEPIIVRADEVVIATVNNVKPLDGLQAIDGRGAIIRNGAAADARGDRFQRAFEGLGNDIEGRVGVTEFIGSSLRDSSLIEAGDGAAINVETLIRDRTILISVDNRSSVACVVPVKSYTISGSNGEPLPSWLRGDAKGLITGKIPAGVEAINLRVEATLTNGVKLERHIKIGTTTGAIRQVEPATRPHAGLSLSQMVAAARDTSVRGGIAHLLD